MYRWLEQFELKHAEFERVIRSFDYSVKAWTSAANSQSPDQIAVGMTEVANRHASVYQALAVTARNLYEKCADPILRGVDEQTRTSFFWERASCFRAEVLEPLTVLVHAFFFFACFH